MSQRIKERPFNAYPHEVTNILAGRQTQLRRAINPQPVGGDTIEKRGIDDGWIIGQMRDSENAWRVLNCPHGQRGERLWLREAWSAAGLEPLTQRWRIIYAAGGEADKPGDIPDYFVATPGKRPSNRLRSSIHMPRWASRLTLEIVNVRVERLQEINADDCASEGIQYPVRQSNVEGKVSPLLRVTGQYPPTNYLPREYGHDDLMRAHFASGWDELNAKRGFSWESNCWVWVISFRRIEGNQP